MKRENMIDRDEEKENRDRKHLDREKGVRKEH
jgi:hypothetical protein